MTEAAFALTDLLGADREAAGRNLEETVRFLLRRSHGSNPFAREREDDLVQGVITAALEARERGGAGKAPEGEG